LIDQLWFNQGKSGSTLNQHRLKAPHREFGHKRHKSSAAPERPNGALNEKRPACSKYRDRFISARACRMQNIGDLQGPATQLAVSHAFAWTNNSQSIGLLFGDMAKHFLNERELHGR
jgi:hypothetical protein